MNWRTLLYKRGLATKPDISIHTVFRNNSTSTMAFNKMILLLVVVAMASAEFGHDSHSGADYKFEYSVHDPHSHDVKSQAESRHGDVVKGFYTLKEADGTTREVHYTADGKNGFQADVQRSGHAAHPQHYTQPQQYAEPQHYVQPQHFQAAPVHHFHQGLGHAFSSNNNNLFSHHF